MFKLRFHTIEPLMQACDGVIEHRAAFSQLLDHQDDVAIHLRLLPGQHEAHRGEPQLNSKFKLATDETRMKHG